ncbi:tyrosine-protein phosphatase [Notoacmeibacter sp. MSK16QG-6]|uniref:tyrosine-protein phosphatase n=1 Tax=Notoacmeibacter sp. MSK16QG-6 TaxID=2957982 RepID=UPI00209E57AF|nr:CpsB/CapC family capsule biosynthesis tyrosine phosphatase [Notoacmeibacter sp. MSK16QG-6]MCP1198075.1 capsular biosynthesis protein [Notoacmeibacter sp. MSK16QG-6]
MIDLHSHLLPGLDDGSPDLQTSLAMAKMALEDGTRLIACTPHRTPGLYDTTSDQIRDAVATFREELKKAGIPLTICGGSDIHVCPELPELLAAEPDYRLARSDYFLFEPPHQFLPPKLIDLVERVRAGGFRPILTHPERLRWVGGHYDVFEGMIRAGCLVQVTAGSLEGRFGREAKGLAWRMVDEGLVDIIASDAHNLTSRSPRLSAAAALIGEAMGETEQWRMTVERPASILKNEPLEPVGIKALEQIKREQTPPARSRAPRPLWERFLR